MTPYGIGLVARREIRARLRSGRWKPMMAGGFVGANALGLLFRMDLENGLGPWASGAVPMFGGVLLAALVLTLMIAPVLGARSINGERERGALAALQIARLAPGDIALGRFLALWGTAMTVLLLALPCALIPVLEGAVGLGRALVAIGVAALLVGIVSALSLGWSALVARSVTSVLLSYLTVFTLLGGTVLGFVSALPFTAETRLDGDVRHNQERSDAVWWLLAPNPVVVLADAAPRRPPEAFQGLIAVSGLRTSDENVFLDDRLPKNLDPMYPENLDPMYPGMPDPAKEPTDPLGEVGDWARDARAGSIGHEAGPIGGAGPVEAGPVWTYGLAFDLALAGAALWAAARRLRSPVRQAGQGPGVT